jgi:hypothetical protein
MNGLNLHDIERRGWRATLQGGLTEILFGILMLGGATSYVLSDFGAPSSASSGALLAACALGLLLTYVLRRRYVAPRVGRARFSAARRRRLRRMRVLLAACVAVTVGLVVATVLAGRANAGVLGVLHGYRIAAVVSAVVLVPLGALALFLDHPRFLLLGGLIAAAEFALATFDRYGGPPHDRVLAYGVLGAVSLIVGFATFARFVRRVPRIDREVSNDACS